MTSRPTGPYRHGVGGDFAYTSSTKADYSVAIEGRAYGEDLYLTDMLRAQVEVPEWLALLRARGMRTLTAYMGGTEKAIEQMARREGVNVIKLPALKDKFTRAQPVAAAWNTGRVFVPRNAVWVDDLLSELLEFSGEGDKHE